MKVKLFFTFLICFISFNLLAQCTTTPTTYEEFQTCNATIAATYAPNIFQNKNTTYIDAAIGKADIITRVDYDGDWNHLNNWDNLPSTSPSPSLYYSVHWTENFLVIIYTLYYARDYAIGVPDVGIPMALICNGADEHEGDGGRIMVIVNRSTNAVEGTIITGHGDHDSQVAPGSGLTLVGSNPTALEISGNTTTLYSAAGSHSLYYHLIGYEIYDSPNPCRPEVTGNNLFTPSDYSLIDVMTPGGLWNHRFGPNLFKENWQFKGDNRNKNKTPWAPWQGDRVEDMFNFISDRFNGFNDDGFLFNSYDCEFELDAASYKECGLTTSLVAVDVSSMLPKTEDNLISDVYWVYDNTAFTCIGCDDPTNFSPSFINHSLQNGTTPSNGRPITVKFETVDCGYESLTTYIPSNNTDEIYINGYSYFNSGSPFNNQIKDFKLVGNDVGNAENISWTLGPHLTCVSGCYGGNPISIKPVPNAPDGTTYIEAHFTNATQGDCDFKIRQKITIDLDQPSLDFDFASLDLEECLHDGDELTLPFNYHGTWHLGFPIINVEATLTEVSSGNTYGLATDVEADHDPNDDGLQGGPIFFGSGQLNFQVMQDLPPGNYQLNVIISFTNFQNHADGHFASLAIDGETICHDYGLKTLSTTFECTLPFGNVCVLPCNVDVGIEISSEQSTIGLITSMTATVVSNNPGSYEYQWSNENASNALTINCGNEVFSVTVANPLTGCVRVFSEINLYTSYACQHGPPRELGRTSDPGSDPIKAFTHCGLGVLQYEQHLPGNTYTWQFDSGLRIGQQGAFATIFPELLAMDQQFVYTLEITNKQTTKTISGQIDMPVCGKEAPITLIHPNPIDQVLYLDLKEVSGINWSSGVAVALLDSASTVQSNFHSKQKELTIPVDNLTEGLYYLLIKDHSGKSVKFAFIINISLSNY